MFNLHEVNSFGDPLRFIPIYRVGATSCYGTKTTTACAGVAKDHECGRAGSPALAHVWTVAALANSMQPVSIYKAANMLIIVTNREFYTKPIGLFEFHLCRRIV